MFPQVQGHTRKTVIDDTDGPCMWETSIPISYRDYGLQDNPSREQVLKEHVKTVLSMFQDNLNIKDDIKCFEVKGTTEQSKSLSWHNERLLRMTASTSKQTCSFGEKIRGGNIHSMKPMANYIKLKLWFAKNIQTQDMKYGLSEEPNARKAYMDTADSTVVETGMWVNVDFLFLGASPDGLIIENNEAVGLLEIKCLKIMKDLTVLELIEKIEKHQLSTTLIGRQCFKLVDGKLILKVNHKFYYQTQLQMLVTGLPFCDFVLHTPKGPPSIQRIQQDIPFQMEMARNISVFWKKVFIPEYFEMRIPRGLTPFVL